MIGKIGFKCPCGGSFVVDSGPHDEPHCNVCHARLPEEPDPMTPAELDTLRRRAENAHIVVCPYVDLAGEIRYAVWDMASTAQMKKLAESTDYAQAIQLAYAHVCPDCSGAGWGPEDHDGLRSVCTTCQGNKRAH